MSIQCVDYDWLKGSWRPPWSGKTHMNSGDMSTHRLKTRIRRHGLPGPVARVFRQELLRVAAVGGAVQPLAASLVEHLMEDKSPDVIHVAPFEALWQYSCLFIEACITVAVADGRYSVDKARHISQLAHRLGFSARQLSDLEREVLGALIARSEGHSATGAP